MKVTESMRCLGESEDSMGQAAPLPRPLSLAGFPLFVCRCLRSHPRTQWLKTTVMFVISHGFCELRTQEQLHWAILA